MVVSLEVFSERASVIVSVMLCALPSMRIVLHGSVVVVHVQYVCLFSASFLAADR